MAGTLHAPHETNTTPGTSDLRERFRRNPGWYILGVGTAAMTVAALVGTRIDRDAGTPFFANLPGLQNNANGPSGGHNTVPNAPNTVPTPSGDFYRLGSSLVLKCITYEAQPDPSGDLTTFVPHSEIIAGDPTKDPYLYTVVSYVTPDGEPRNRAVQGVQQVQLPTSAGSAKAVNLVDFGGTSRAQNVLGHEQLDMGVVNDVPYDQMVTCP